MSIPHDDPAYDNAVTVDFSDDPTLGTTGRVIYVRLPSGITLDLWVYDQESTTSIDVRAGREPGEQMRLAHVVQLPNKADLRVAAVVIENRG